MPKPSRVEWFIVGLILGLVAAGLILATAESAFGQDDEVRGHYMGPPDNCTHGQTISWDATAREWVCATASGGGGGGPFTCGIPALTLSTSSAAGDSGQAICTNSVLAIFDVGVPAPLAVTADAGNASTAARRNHVHPFPASLMAANGDLLTITSDGATVTAEPTAGRSLRLEADGSINFNAGTGFLLDTAAGNVTIMDPIVFHAAPRPDANGSVGIGVAGTGILDAYFANLLNVYTTRVVFNDVTGFGNGTLTINMRGLETQTLELPVWYLQDDNLDKLEFTSDGTDTTLQWTRPNGDLKLKDEGGIEVAIFHDSSFGNYGIWNKGHMLVGEGTALLTDVGENQVLAVAERVSDTPYSELLRLAPTVDTNICSGGTGTLGITTATYGLQLATGFECTDGGGVPVGEQFTLKGHSVNWGGSLGGAALVGNAQDVVLFEAAANITIPAASAAWMGEIVGYRLDNLTFTNAGSSYRSYGLKIETGGNAPATARWAGMFGGDVQLTAGNRLRFGSTLTTQATDAILRQAAGTLRFEIGGTGELDLNLNALQPVATGGLGLGAANLGFSVLVLNQSGGGNEITFSAGTLGGDRTLAWSQDGNYTLTLNGSPTLNNWFDQDVRTTASPTFVSPVVTTSLLPDATGGASIGSATLGFTDAFFKDSVNAVEHRVQMTGATADRTLTVDVTDADRTLKLPIGYTNVNTHGMMFWGDSSDSFDTGDEVCPSHSLVCVTTFTPAGVSQTCAFDHGTAGTYFYALCK